MDDITPERWLSVPGYEGRYEVSDQGTVRTLRRPRVKGGPLKPWAGEWGHLHVNLRRDGQQKQWAVHRLVALIFIGPCPDGLEVRHLDGNPANNAVDNLAYGTHAENMQDMIAHGTSYWANVTHCPQDHEYTPENTWVEYHSDGHPRKRVCRTCLKERSKAWRDAHRDPRRVCPQCGQQFVRSPGPGNQKYCSKECSKAARKAWRVA